MDTENKKKSVVVMGGGTGTYSVLKGLKQYKDKINITAIISMADSGGSTGRLRDEFGHLPVGDVRMALAALSRDIDDHEELLRELFLYRFERGEGLKGHNFGNLLLTALTDILGTEAEAVEVAGKILRIQGKVIPVTADNVQLVATYDDGHTATGEHMIDDPSDDRKGKKIVQLTTEPKGMISDDAQAALCASDLVIIGPGDLYSSLVANLVIEGVPEALQQCVGKLMFITNLMERPGQTEGMTVSECVSELDRYIGRSPDIVLVNNTPLPPEIVEHYKETEGTKPVVDDVENFAGTVVREDVLAVEPIVLTSSDTVKRSLIRHDADKVATIVMKLLQ